MVGASIVSYFWRAHPTGEVCINDRHEAWELCIVGLSKGGHSAYTPYFCTGCRMPSETDGVGLAAGWNDGDRLVAIGDIHGDLEQANKVLQLLNVIDANGRWIAGKSTVVQTGDLVDRGDESLEVVALFEDLKVCCHSIMEVSAVEQLLDSG